MLLFGVCVEFVLVLIGFLPSERTQQASHGKQENDKKGVLKHEMLGLTLFTQNIQIVIGGILKNATPYCLSRDRSSVVSSRKPALEGHVMDLAEQV